MSISVHNPAPKRRVSRRQAIRRSLYLRHLRHAASHERTWQSIAAIPLSWRREHWVLGGLILGICLFALVLLPAWAGALRPEMPQAAPVGELRHIELTPPQTTALLAPELTAPGTGDENWRVVAVKPGKTLAQIFSDQGLSAADVHRVVTLSDKTAGLARIHPGDEIEFRIVEGRLTGLRFSPGEGSLIELVERDGKLVQSETRLQMEPRIEFAQATIDSSLFDAGVEAGMTDRLILEMANAFAYDIDFALDIREGDRFSVMYEQIFHEGEKIRDGNLIAASFETGGKRFLAFRFVGEDGRVGYYSADGRPLKKAFIRTPVDFTRISSRFTNARRHPILGTMRAHRGVDYAAPTGTPVKAAGDGKIIFRGVKGGYGNCVIVQHGGNTTTLYGHLSRFAPNLRQGTRVNQGQTIGYVGSTGLASGPHLHYEFRIAGAHRDPLKVDLPKADPLTGGELAQFRRQMAPILARLDLLEDRPALAAR